MSETLTGSLSFTFGNPLGIFIDALPGSLVGSQVLVITGTYGGGTPTNATGVWSPGAVSAGLTGFSAGNGRWTATVTAPASNNTYTLVLTGSGGNTSISPASSPAVVTVNVFSITAISANANINTNVPISGTYAGGVPTNMSGVWSPGAIPATISAFHASGGVWDALAATPSSANTFTLTGTAQGPNTALSSPSTGIVVSIVNAITITSIPGTATAGSGVNVSGTFTGLAPTGLTAVWSAGSIPGAVTNFSTGSGTWSATIAAPLSAATYTLIVTGTGPNISASAASSSVGVSAPSGVTLVAHTQVSGLSGVTTSAINTTGATILIVNIATHSSFSPPPTDSKGNTWIQINQGLNSGSVLRLFYALNPVVGTGHTFTVSAEQPAMGVMAFSGVDTVAPLASTVLSGGYENSVPAGTLVPPVDGCLIAVGLCCNNIVADAAISGFTIADQVACIVDTHMGGATAYLAQSSAVSINPTWTVSGSTPQSTTIAAVFRPQSGGVVDTIAITSIPANASVATATSIQGTYTGNTPTGLSAVWSPGAVSGAVTGFSASNGVWNASIGTPSSAGSYTLIVTGTGGNTAASPASSSIAVSANALAIASVPVSANPNSAVPATGTYTGVAPTGLTAAWSGSGGTGTVVNFSASAGNWSAGITSPVTPGTYTVVVTGTGPNTSISGASPSVTVSTTAGPAIVRVVVGASTYDLDLSFRVSEGTATLPSPYNVTQLWYNVPVTSGLAAALPGVVVKYRPDNSGGRQEVIFEMSQGIGPDRAALPSYSFKLLNGDGTTVTMVDGTGIALANSTWTVPAGQIIGQRVRMISAVRPVKRTPAQIATLGLTPTYQAAPLPSNGSNAPTVASDWGVTAYVPWGANGVNFSAATGGRVEINLLPEYTSQYLAVGDVNSFRSMMIAAETIGNLAAMVRDSSGQIFNINNFPTYDKVPAHAPNHWAQDLSLNSATPPLWDLSHFGSFSYVPFLLTGDFYYLENLQATTNVSIIQDDTGAQVQMLLISMGGAQLRAVAWILRELAFTCLATPGSGLPATMLPRTQWLQKLQNNHDWLKATTIDSVQLESQTFHQFWWVNAMNCDYSLFMHYYFAQVVGAMVWAGLPWQDLLDWNVTMMAAMGNGTSGWGGTQPGIATAGLQYTAGSMTWGYHGNFARGDFTASTGWADAWSLNTTTPSATFTGTLTVATSTLTVTGKTGPLSLGQTIIGTGLPKPVANSNNGVTIISGNGGGSYVVSIPGGLSGTIGPESMRSQLAAPSGPFTTS